MGKLIDLTGKRFGLLTVTDIWFRKNRRTYWKCVCDCGVETETQSHHLITGHTQSCGCLVKTVNSELRKTHNLRRTPDYNCWASMRQRCTNPNTKSYKNYGGRGITICKRWEKFENFYKDMGPRPEGMSLDRINVNGNYEPGNCRWADAKTQANNTRTNRVIEYQGIKKTITQWADHIGISEGTIRDRLNNGWSAKRALTEPVNKNVVAYNEKSLTIKQWASEINIDYDTLRARILTYKWPVKKAIETPLANWSRHNRGGK